MKIFSIIAIILSLITVFLYDNSKTPEIIVIKENIKTLDNPEKAPNIIDQTLDGKKFSLHDLAEPKILLNFWASWCKPCVKELPDMIKLVNQSNGKIALVAISIDYKKNALEDFIKNLNIQNSDNIYFIWDQNKEISLTSYGTSSIPETIILDQNKLMIKKIIGAASFEQLSAI